MEPIIIAYLCLGGVMILALAVVILRIAGRDMFYAIYRWINPRGADIFILNPNRHFDHYYKIPKEGIFKIADKIYITNPNKTEGLSDEMVKEVKLKMDLKLNRIDHLVNKLRKKQQFIESKLKIIERKEENLPVIDTLQLQYTEIENKINLLLGKKELREQTYFNNRRACYLYIENDPVPKDMFEFYTEMDCIQLENLILRAQTKDAGKNIVNMEASISFIKKVTIATLIIALITLWFAFKTNDAVTQLANNLGIHIKI